MSSQAIIGKVFGFVAPATASVLFIAVAYASHFYMGEVITPHIIIGTTLISAGVCLLGLGKNDGS